MCTWKYSYLNVYVNVSWYIYMYIYGFFTYVNVCMLATKPQPNWRTFFSSKLHLKWLLCIFGLPNAMPCWDDCCVDESPQTDLSGKQMADDRREFKSSKVRSIPSFVFFVSANLGVHTIEQNLRKSSWNTPSTNGDNGSSGSFSLLKKSRNVFTFVCHFRRTSRTIASFSILQTSFICWAALPRNALLRWNMLWFWYNRIILRLAVELTFSVKSSAISCGWDASGSYWAAFLASSSSIFWRETSPRNAMFFLKKISPKDAK